MATNVYTADEVARHRNTNDLWVTMNGKVYDLTPFVKQHPGGEEVLLDVAGEDATTCFDSIGHSAEAQFRRDKYMIGELIESVATNQPDQRAGLIRILDR
jgi:cytochrome b involved in lipid metabolism